jgi:hypothetical protein
MFLNYGLYEFVRECDTQPPKLLATVKYQETYSLYARTKWLTN